MRSDLIITRIPEHTDAWYEYRKNSIGGSEIGTILGLNKYDTVMRVFHEKVGDYPARRDDNESMFWGRELEDKIADVWRYYDGSELGYIENYKAGRIIRDCRSVNGYVVNPEYPWLSASVDRLINAKTGINFITGEKLQKEAILECKQLSYFAAQMWQDGIPISYLAQIHQYMIIFDADYGEIAMLQDGNKLRVERFIRDEELCKRIIEISKAFWYNRVLPAKESFAKKMEAEKSGNFGEVDKMEGEIQRFEPEPDNTEAYNEFMNERFLRERESIEGTIDTYELCKKDKLLLGVSNLIKDARDLIKNTLITDLTKAGAEAIDFGKLGTFSWAERKGSKNRVASNKIKEAPTEDRLIREFSKINQEWD